MKVALVILFLIPFLCEGKTTFAISKENAVYETTFAYFIKDATIQINISNNTKVNGSLGDIENAEGLVEFDTINEEKLMVSTELLNDLIKINYSESIINWKPIMVSALFDSFEQSNHTKSGIAYYQVSRVAFSKDSTKALVNFTYNCILCGSSSLIYLEFVNNRWVIKGARLLWVS